MRATSKRRIWKSVGQNWGYLVLALVAYGWFIADRTNPVLLLVGSALVIVFALFFAETPCMAINKEKRDGEVDYCGNNGRGLLGACHLKRHKWENLKALSSRQRGVQALRHTVSRFCGQAAAFSAAAGIGSLLVATLTFVFVATRQPPPVP
ncbi:hypothetical protein [Actinomycetospora flava]|uniref:Uncharacterized protein n=1 Tax=Actinomycetospora flava TaxID=3129232 RepID=A0ABU8M0S4_9PSEU